MPGISVKSHEQFQSRLEAGMDYEIFIEEYSYLINLAALLMDCELEEDDHDILANCFDDISYLIGYEDGIYLSDFEYKSMTPEQKKQAIIETFKVAFSEFMKHLHNSQYIPHNVKKHIDVRLNLIESTVNKLTN